MLLIYLFILLNIFMAYKVLSTAKKVKIFLGITK